MCLSIAFRILASEQLQKEYLKYAQELLTYYVKMYPLLYGKEHVSYNVHSLIHLPYYVSLYGPVDNFSAFKFENYLQKLKKKVKTCTKPLQQLVNRIYEENTLEEKTSEILTKKIWPIIIYQDIPNETDIESKKIKSLQYENFILKTKKKDSYCNLTNEYTFQIEEIVSRHKDIYLTGKVYMKSKPFFTIPHDSTKFGIKLIKNIDQIPLTIKSCCIKFKLVSLPLNEKEFVVLPLLHKD